MPRVTVDKLIFNNAIPSTDEVAQALVASLNNNDYAYGHGSQYLGGSKLKLNVGVNAGLIRILGDTPLSGSLAIGPSTAPMTDGYAITVKMDARDIAVEDYGIYPPGVTIGEMMSGVYQVHEDMPIFITGSISSVTAPNRVDASILTVIIHIESIEY